MKWVFSRDERAKRARCDVAQPGTIRHMSLTLLDKSRAGLAKQCVTGRGLRLRRNTPADLVHTRRAVVLPG